MPSQKPSDPIDGIGDRVSFDKVREILKAQREHIEEFDKMEPNFNVFAGCTFPAHCRELKWNRNGTLVIPLEVAYRYISLAEPMIYASGIPLAVHIERFSPLRKPQPKVLDLDAQQ